MGSNFFSWTFHQEGVFTPFYLEAEAGPCKDRAQRGQKKLYFKKSELDVALDNYELLNTKQKSKAGVQNDSNIAELQKG